VGKLRRGALWVLFPPAGAVASVRAGQHKDTQRIVDAIDRTHLPPPPPQPKVVRGPYGFAGALMIPGDALTANGFIRRDGVVLLPKKTLQLFNAWRSAGDVKGMTEAEITQRVGAQPEYSRGPGRNGLGFTQKWGRPGYVVTIWFDDEGRALGMDAELG
jgi:hypothetical protein